jgi:hypothetical protein
MIQKFSIHSVCIPITRGYMYKEVHYLLILTKGIVPNDPLDNKDGHHINIKAIT